jgi:hypothetical protein
MTVKDFLLQPAELKKAVQCKKERIQELRMMKNYSRSIIEFNGKRQKNFRESKVCTLVCKISELEQKLLYDIATYVKQTEQAVGLLENIKSTDARTLMERHYLLGETWEKVAEEMYLSIRTVHNLNKQSLKSLEPIYKKICGGENNTASQQSDKEIMC